MTAAGLFSHLFLFQNINPIIKIEINQTKLTIETTQKQPKSKDATFE